MIISVNDYLWNVNSNIVLTIYIYLTMALIWHESIFHKALKVGILFINLFLRKSQCFPSVLNKGNTGTIFITSGMTRSFVFLISHCLFKFNLNTVKTGNTVTWGYIMSVIVKMCYLKQYFVKYSIIDYSDLVEIVRL